jgi:hypothetical protein
MSSLFPGNKTPQKRVSLNFLGRTAFIVGPQRQAQLMFAPERLLSTLIYLAATIAVFLTAINVNDNFFVTFEIYFLHFCVFSWLLLEKKCAGSDIVDCTDW